MAIQITRIDPLAGIPDSHAIGVLSKERFSDWDAAIKSLRDRGIPVTDEHAAEFRTHPDTQFAWNEFINAGVSAYSCHVQYDVREIDSAVAS